MTYNYACMLVLLVVQSSSELRMMEQHAAPLLALAKVDETNAKLQGNYHQYCVIVVLCHTIRRMSYEAVCAHVFYPSELSKWLEPLDKLRFEIGSIPTLIDYIKQVQICYC